MNDQLKAILTALAKWAYNRGTADAARKVFAYSDDVTAQVVDETMAGRGFTEACVPDQVWAWYEVESKLRSEQAMGGNDETIAPYLAAVEDEREKLYRELAEIRGEKT